MVLTVAALIFQLASPAQPLLHSAFTQPAPDNPRPKATAAAAS